MISHQSVVKRFKDGNTYLEKDITYVSYIKKNNTKFHYWASTSTCLSFIDSKPGFVVPSILSGIILMTKKHRVSEENRINISKSRLLKSSPSMLSVKRTFPSC